MSAEVETRCPSVCLSAAGKAKHLERGKLCSFTEFTSVCKQASILWNSIHQKVLRAPF